MRILIGRSSTGEKMDTDKIIEKVLAFRDEREWSQFHNPKDLAISISLEASELLEAFQWSGSELFVGNKKEYLKHELADILIYCIYLADVLDLDLKEIILEKLKIAEDRYTLEKSRGNAKKYTEI